MLCTPSQVNSKTSPQEALFNVSQPQQPNPDTNRFCADPVAQIRIATLKHAVVLNNRPAIPMADLNFVSVGFVFIFIPLFCFSLIELSFHRGTAGKAAGYNAESWLRRVKSLKRCLLRQGFGGQGSVKSEKQRITG